MQYPSEIRTKVKDCGESLVLNKLYGLIDDEKCLNKNLEKWIRYDWRDTSYSCKFANATENDYTLRMLENMQKTVPDMILNHHLLTNVVMSKL